MKKIFALVMAMVMLSLCILSASAAVDVEQSEKRVFKNSDTTLPYRLILPENYDETKSYPMLVFLHGAGERGNDNKLQLFHCVQYLANNLPECIIVAPQCPVGNQWVDTPWANGAYSIERVKESNELKAVVELLDDLQEEFNVDADRIYASGLSMGGFGAWDLMMRHNDYFAAGILVCGGGDPSQAEKLVDTPLFVFHGDADDAVPVSGSRDTVQAIKDAGGQLVKYVEYPGQGHGIWNNAFAHTGMLKELLTYRLSERYPDKGTEESTPEESTPAESAPAESTPEESAPAENAESVTETASAPAESIAESAEESAISPILLTLSVLGFALPACTVIVVLLIAKKKQQ